jgi:4-hydroxybenzoate polyprenyltransferase
VSRPARRLLALVRWHDWFGSKLLLVAVAGYYCLAAVPPQASALAKFALVLVGTTALAAFGHLTNDLSDVAVDKAANKPREAHRWDRRLVLAVCGATAAAAVLSYYAADPGHSTLLLALGAVGLAAAYSLRPLRLKERGLLGVLAAATAQRVAPGLVAAGIFRAATPGIYLFLAALGLQGVRYILFHQLADAWNDRRTGVQTFALLAGRDATFRILDALPLLELPLLAASLCLAPCSSPALALLLAPSLVAQVYRLRGQSLEERAWSPRADPSTAYELVLPGALVGLLVVQAPALYSCLIALELACKWRLLRKLLSQKMLGTVRLVEATRR